MINELAKIIEILEIPESDPAAKRLQKRGLAFYKSNEMDKLKTEIGPRYFEVKHYDLRSNARNETQEFESVSYLFGACINFQDKDYGGAIKIASYALAMFRQTSRGRTFNEGLAHWFLGTLYRLVNENCSAIEEFKEATSILDELTRAFEIESNYDQMFYCIKLRPQIAARVPPKLFSDIIGQLSIPEEDSQLYEWWAAIRNMEPSDLVVIDTNIDSLKTILASETESSPFYFIFLVHCYNLGFYTREGPLEYQEYALITAAEEFDDYLGNMYEYNQLLSHKYLAFLYYNIFDIRNGLSHLKEANNLLARLLEGNIDSGIIDFQSLQMDLQARIHQFETEIMFACQETPEDEETQEPNVGILEKILTPIKRLIDNASAPEVTSPAPNKAVYNNSLPPPPTLKSKHLQPPSLMGPPPTPRNPSTGESSNPNVRLLVVPVDLRALEETRINDTVITPEDMENLAKYDKEYAKLKYHTQPFSSRPNAPSTKRIPPFPIYGYVSAGLNGEAILPDPEELAEGIDEESVTFNGLQYRIRFIESPPPSFSHNKKYGWLKVTGESMNKTTPIPILPNDYVLFCENHSLEACTKKIVIALLSEMQSQPPRPMVKRLVKMSGEIPCGDDGFGPELCKFMLHSESSLERDPITKMSLKKDVEIENDYQLVGEVIAVAKR